MMQPEDFYGYFTFVKLALNIFIRVELSYIRKLKEN